LIVQGLCDTTISTEI